MNSALRNSSKLANRLTGIISLTDHLRLADSHVPMAHSLLENHKFDVSKWYAKCSQALNLDEKLTHHYDMGFSISLVAVKLLTNGIPSLYPCANPGLDPKDRFTVYPPKFHGDEYIIMDEDLHIHVPLAKSLLENPSFELVNWYRHYLDEKGIFEECCMDTHFQNMIPRLARPARDLRLVLKWKLSLMNVKENTFGPLVICY